jgi:hypothetical protein
MSNHTTEFYKALSYSTAEFDKSIVFIASGALGISMAFVDKLVKLENASNKWLLVYAWYAFGITIFISLVSHFFSSMAIRWSIVNCPTEECTDAEDEAYRKKENHWNQLIRGLNILMIITLFIGIIMFLNFINKNLTN